jgi:hypothetical protein
MAGELATLAADMAPYISAAASAYGGAVLAKVRDDSADATVGLGRRLLQRIFGRAKEGEALPGVLAEVVKNSGDEDYLTPLQGVIVSALKNDPQMLAEVREILAEAGSIVKITQNVRAGRNAYVVGHGDMYISRAPD